MDNDNEELRSNNISISLEELTEIVEACQDSTSDEDIRLLKILGGKEGLVNKLNTHLELGLKGDDFALREELFGNNQLTVQYESKCTEYVWYIHGVLILIVVLSICCLILSSIFISHNVATNTLNWISFILIGLVLLGLETIFEQKLNSKIRRDHHKAIHSSNKVTVIRNGEKKAIDESQLEVGDVYQLDVGMIIPCDSILISQSVIDVDESSVTGESLLIKKMDIETCINEIEQPLEENKLEGNEGHRNITKYRKTLCPVPP